MGQYRKKPVVIEAVEFRPPFRPEASFDGLLGEFKWEHEIGVFLNVRGVRIARRTADGYETYNMEFAADWQVYNKLHDSWIKVQPGDMLRVDQAPDDVYPIAAKVFAETYDAVPAYETELVREYEDIPTLPQP